MTPDTKKAVRALVDAILRDRPDRHLLEPALLCALATEVNDFERYHPVELAGYRLREAERVRLDPRFRRQREAEPSV